MSERFLQDEHLQRLQRDIAMCRICIDHPVDKRPLPHEPRPVAVLSSRAKILIAGQAPGLKVHETGIPFNDASGDRLRQWLNVSREDFYDADQFAILPMGFCFPGYDANKSDLPPRKECAPFWRQPVLDAMPQIDLILAVGTYAQSWHLPGNKLSMTETVSTWLHAPAQNRSPMVIPLPHPSWRNTGWLKRNPWFEDELLPKLREWVKNRMK